MPARLDEIHEVAVNGFDFLSKAGSKTLEALAVVFSTAREMGRDVRVRNFVLATRDHSHPRAAGSLGVGVKGDIVVDDQVGRDLAEPEFFDTFVRFTLSKRAGRRRGWRFGWSASTSY